MSVVQSPTTGLLVALVLAAFACSIAAVWHLEGRGRWRALLTDRFCYGVPWGTLVVIGFVLAVYLVLQGGYRHWSNPLVIPFRAWSYLYPTGVLAAGFSHGSPSHLIGNLVGTLVLAPIVEYAWGHYPRDDGEQHRRLDAFGRANEGAVDETTPEAATPSGVAVRYRARVVARRARSVGQLARATFQHWLRTPWIRAVVLFPLGVLAVGLFTSLFFLGPVIGFSGVVFALGGFALIHYPVTTMVALLLSSVVNTTYQALQNPVVERGISGSAPSPPWWAEVAVQAHALGVLVGVLLGLAVLFARARRPRAGRVFLAILVYGFTRNLWAVYWFAGDGHYVLYRGVGVVLVVGLALLVTVAAAAGDRPVNEALAGFVEPLRRRGARSSLRVPGRSASGLGVARRLASRRRLAWASLLVNTLLVTVAVVGFAVRGWSLLFTVVPVLLVAFVFAAPAIDVLIPDVETGEPPTSRQTAFAALVLVAALLGGVAIYPNLVTTGQDAVPGSGSVDVQDYTVTYEENVENQLIPAIELPWVEASTQTRTSGVIVVSEERHVWTTALSRQYLASEGTASVTLGGPGWRDDVDVQRQGWNVQGNGSVYVVDVAANGDRVRSFESPARRAEPRIAGHHVAIEPASDGFEARVEGADERVGTAAIPAAGESVAIGELRLQTEAVDGRSTLFATANGTRVRIATRERYSRG